MKQEIKKRIEKIHKGEVPEGYKKTKLGIIPEDWDVVELGDLGEFKKGKGVSSKDIKKTGLPAIMYGDIYIKYDTHFKKVDFKIDEETSKNSTLVKKGDLLFTGTGETATEIGKCVSYQADEELYIGGDIIALTLNKGNSLFLAYQQNSYNQIKQKAKIGQGYSIVHIYTHQINSLKIFLPSCSEQQKIAEILSIWDKAIELKEKQISHSNEYKKGFMQKLLFKRETSNTSWNETQLRKCLMPTSYPVNKPSEPYNALGIRSHCKGTIVKPIEDPKKIAMDTLYEVKENELIVNITFGWEGAITLLSKKDEGKLVSHRFPTYKFNEEYTIPDYFKHLIKTKWFVFQLGLLSPGGAGRNRVLSKKDFLKLKVLLPPVEEQRKIADFLNSLDDEINLLNNELNQLKEQKRGLMQLLLTGIVRVNT